MKSKRKESEMPKGGDFEDRKGGRPEVLTHELALKICRLIETMPDLEIEVSWDNVAANVERKFGHKIGKRQLAQKSWGDRKLIGEAFSSAQEVQRLVKADGGRRHATTSRQNLLRKIETLEAKLQQASQELDAARAIRYDSLDRLRVTTSDLRKVVEGNGNVP